VPDEHFPRTEYTFMPAEENVQLMRRWFREVWNEGRTQTIYDLLSPDVLAIGQAGSGAKIQSPEEFAAFAERIRNAFPDIQVTIEDLFGADDKVVVRWSTTMTHRGDALGIPATGKPVRITGITIARIHNGQIVEGWDNWDQLAMLEQIGAYKQPETITLAKSA
jgi:steroid delta-isomerase-like uncharacterized protein